MITLDDIEKVHTSLAQAELFYRLIIERDQALEKVADLEARIGYVQNECWEKHSGLEQKLKEAATALHLISRTDGGDGWVIPTMREVEVIKKVLALIE